jgi:hypothetical protein
MIFIYGNRWKFCCRKPAEKWKQRHQDKIRQNIYSLLSAMLTGAPIAIPAYMAMPFQVITFPELEAHAKLIPQVNAPVTRMLSPIP